MPITADVLLRPLAQPLPPVLGGTGTGSLSAAITAMLPPQGGNAGRVLATDGVNLSWVAGVTNSGTVTSVNVVGGTGISTQGGPITSQGTISVRLNDTGVTSGTYTNPMLTVDSQGRITSIATGSAVVGVSSFNTRTGAVTLSAGDVTGALSGSPLPISAGGTGSTTASSALSAILPSQSGQAGKVLSTDGSTASWTTVSGGSGSAGVSSFNTRSGAVSLVASDVAQALSTSSVTTINTTGGTANHGIYLTRTANYTGGAAGFVNSALFIDTTVGSSSNRNQSSFEWGLTSRINNYTNFGENVAIYGQGNRISGNGPIWGMVAEACDLSNSSTGISSASTVGLEVDVWANGTDEFERRVGIDVVVGNAQQIRFGNAGVGKCYAYDGVRVGPSNGNIASGEFKYGFNVLEGGGQSAGVVINANGDRGVWVRGNNISGVCIEGSYSSSAIRVPANNFIALEGTDTIKMRYNSSNGFLEFFNGNTRHGYIDITSGNDVNLANTTGGSSTITLTGDVTGSGVSNITAALSNTGVTAGTYGVSGKSPRITVDSKGRITSASEVDIAMPWSSVSGTPTTLSGYGITDAVSTSANVMPLTNGGISSSTYTSNSSAVGQVIDSFDATQFKTAKYLIQAISPSGTQSGEILVMHDGSSVALTEFSGLTLGATVATFDADLNGGLIRFLASPTTASTVFKLVRTTIKS